MLLRSLQTIRNGSGIPVSRRIERDPIACGPKGSIIAFAKEDEKGMVIQVALAEVDDAVIKANTWYGVDLVERKGVAV